MAIDLARCTGCQACVTACYAENNIPTVGEQEILKGREMTWMRIERYWEGGEAPGEPVSARFVPMLCQHCDNAPCEPVCPVYAAYHTADGLNGQVYNRCVGTRYCANNCPYKVRYFNWYKYNEMAWPEPLHLQLNPDVTVRARGVMEKCTFCIQRIRGAQNQARLEDRPIRDGEFTTACAAGLPVRRDRVRRRQRSREPGGRDQAGPPRLPRARGAQHPPGDHLPRQGPASGGGLTDGCRRTARRRAAPELVITQTHADVTRDVVATLEPPSRGLPAAAGRAPSALFLVGLADLPDPGQGRPGPRRIQPADLLERLHHDLRVLDRHRARGHADLGDPVPVPLPVAHGGLPLHRGDDGVRGHDGRRCSRSSTSGGSGSSTGCCRIPNQRYLWPNFKSPLIWDVFAISTYLTVSARPSSCSA